MTDQNKVSGKIINYNSSYIGDVYFSEKISDLKIKDSDDYNNCLLYTSPSPRDDPLSRMPSSA